MAAVHPIFAAISRGDEEAVEQSVLADPAVLEEKGPEHMTPLMYAICHREPAIAHWLIEHRGQHDVNTRDGGRWTALNWACIRGPLSIVQALVASGANPLATVLRKRLTPLSWASAHGHSDIVNYLLRLPAVRSTLNNGDGGGRTALCHACSEGHASCMQLLLNAVADPAIPAGDHSPLNEALSQGHTAVAALLRHAIAEPDRARALHKARALLDAPRAIAKAEQDARGKGDAPAVQRQKAIAAAPVYLKGRVQRDETLHVLELGPQRGDERLGGTAAFVLGLEEGGVEYAGLPKEVYVELLGYLMPAWADNGPEAVVEAEDEGGQDDSESSDEDGG